MPITAERGYLIPAINTDTVDYVVCAQRLADSIRHWHPDAEITIVTRDMLLIKDLKGYANDWQMFKISPYRQTIKLEADMICTSPIDHWWTMFEKRDVVISTGARDIYDDISEYRGYRKIFDDNNLPDVYNAVTYWRLSQTAQEFWDLVQTIFYKWDTFQKVLKFADQEPTTDVVYAIAATIMGPERVTLPFSSYPKIVHMKQHMIPTHSSDWTKELTWEYDRGCLRLNTIAQQGLVHYHIKEWSWV